MTEKDLGAMQAVFTVSQRAAICFAAGVIGALAVVLFSPILFGLFTRTAWNRLYLFGFLYVLAPLAALFLFFLPMAGAGYFGLNKGPTFTLYLLLVNLPFGIVTALTARAIIGKAP